jgi:fatty acid desaturase
MNQKSDEKERSPPIEAWLLVIVLAVLWLNGNANGHTTFLWVPQLFNWLLFFALAVVLISNFLHSAVGNVSAAQKPQS